MAYDRDRDHPSRHDAQHRDRGSRDSSERGFFERSRDEILSWVGDDEAERRREMDERGGRFERGRDDGRSYGGQRDDPQRRPYSGRPPERNETSRDMARRGPDFDRDHDRDRDRDQRPSYRPMTGDYGRAAAERFERDPGTDRAGPATAAGAGVTAAHDRHYSEWRQRQIDAIDQDYDDYRREHQSKFESDFSNWRSTRQSKRQLLGSIKEHMQVFGADDQPVGTVDKVRGDRIILTRGDSPDAQHHSLNCAMIDRVEGDRVILDKGAAEAKAAFGSEERDRALNERDDQRDPGAHILNKSFSGTY